MTSSTLRHIALLLTVSGFLNACASPHHVKALVISEVYDGRHGFPALRYSESDGDLVYNALKQMHTVVTLDRLKDLADMGAKIDRFAATLSEDKGDYAFVYISSHAVRDPIDGSTKLIDRNGNTIDAESLMLAIIPKASASIFFLDVCRDSDPNLKLQHTGKYLHGKNAVVLFSTDTGNRALDSTIFARKTASEIVQRQELRVTLRNIVDAMTGDSSKAHTGVEEQNPWPYGIITRDVYLAGPPTRPGPY